MNLTHWHRRLDNAIDAARRHGATNWVSRIAPPASDSLIRQIEEDQRVAIPDSLRDVACSFAASVELYWFLPEGVELEQPFDQIFSGNLEWNLADLARLDEDRRSWIEACFPNTDDTYDRVWHDKLAFAAVGNGDMLAIETGGEHSGSVVYLSHDGGEGHGLRLAPSFEEYVERMTRIACVGSEDWQWLPFWDEAAGGLDPDGEVAVLWRRTFGLGE